MVPSAGRVAGRPHAGYVPERFPPALAFSAHEYLEHMGRIHGLPPAAVRAAVDEWLERLGAADYARAPLRTLSKGMCQKIAIAQALLARPGLLVLDEAWTGLDQAARGALDAAVAERVAGGGIVLFVDHDPARLADRVDEEWRLAGGSVTVVSAPARQSPAAAGGAAAEAGPAPQTATIEVTGLEEASLDRVAGLAGVLAVVADRPLGRILVTVAGAASDAVLRELLSWDGVHVSAVAPRADQSLSGQPQPREAGGEAGGATEAAQ
jgi:ABC-2 type transport system ATP-binding protein